MDISKMETVYIYKTDHLFKLAKGLELLAKAKVRKIGYEKWNTSAIWFSDSEQIRRVEIIEVVIMRLENYCREKCKCIMINI